MSDWRKSMWPKGLAELTQQLSLIKPTPEEQKLLDAAEEITSRLKSQAKELIENWVRIEK